MSDTKALNIDISDYSELFHNFYNTTKQKTASLVNDGIKASNILAITDVVMKQAASLSLKGAEKRALVIAAVKQLVTDTNISLSSASTAAGVVFEEITGETQELLEMVDMKLGSFIDQIYSLQPQVYGHVTSRWSSLKTSVKRASTKVSTGTKKAWVSLKTAVKKAFHRN